MHKWPCESGPVVIGGIGGSGTRVVAHILSSLGYYLGSDLNDSLDNLGFTLLFKRPAWHRQATTRDIMDALQVFQHAMLGTGIRSRVKRDVVLAAVKTLAVSGHDYRGSGRGLWAINRAMRILFAPRKDSTAFRGWGWKEPNTHIYLEHLNSFFPKLRYIHVVRHGLDMAFSTNQAQLFNWGHLFGIEISPRHLDEIPVISLRYWLEANKRVANLGEKLMRTRFLWVNFDMLCTDPKSCLRHLMDFLQIEVEAKTLKEICQEIHPPASVGRYRNYPLNVFPAELISAVQAMGFPV